MIDQLPYELSPGVTATREGLFFSGPSGAKQCLSPGILIKDPYDGRLGDYWLGWPDAAERLRYREGEPWCWMFDEGEEPIRVHCMSNDTAPFSDDIALHRLAAILCDDAEAFRVLHWCVTNLGGSDD